MELPCTTAGRCRSSAKVEAKGEVISTPQFAPKGWHARHRAHHSRRRAGERQDSPRSFLRHEPAPVRGRDLSHRRQLLEHRRWQPDSPYAVSWWYRKDFTVPAAYKGKTVWLKFNGINYRANIWLNGKQIAKSDDVAGAWRTYEFNVTGAAKPGAENVLAVQVFAPTEHDLAITFVDWNPAPPDKNMGLWREVYLTTSGPVALRYPDGRFEAESARE